MSAMVLRLFALHAQGSYLEAVDMLQLMLSSNTWWRYR
jgi:hypothetical protein